MSVVLLGDFIDYRLSLAGVIGLERGWRRARRTILVADAMSFLCGLVLYVMSVGPVQGFAFTLGLTTLIDVAVVFLSHDREPGDPDDSPQRGRTRSPACGIPGRQDLWATSMLIDVWSALAASACT
jgi:hypothetical protein